MITCGSPETSAVIGRRATLALTPLSGHSRTTVKWRSSDLEGRLRDFIRRRVLRQSPLLRTGSGPCPGNRGTERSTLPRLGSRLRQRRLCTVRALRRPPGEPGAPETRHRLRHTRGASRLPTRSPVRPHKPSAGDEQEATLPCSLKTRFHTGRRVEDPHPVARYARG